MILLAFIAVLSFSTLRSHTPTPTPYPPSQEFVPQNVTTELTDRYAEARTHLYRAGPHWVSFVDSSIGTILVATPGYLDFGPKLPNSLAVYFAANPRGIIILAPAFGGYNTYFEPSWSLLLASILIHEATHDKQYRRGEEFTSASSCYQENEAVANQSAFLIGHHSLLADYYRTRINDDQRSRCG